MGTKLASRNRRSYIANLGRNSQVRQTLRSKDSKQEKEAALSGGLLFFNHRSNSSAEHTAILIR